MKRMYWLWGIGTAIDLLMLNYFQDNFGFVITIIISNLLIAISANYLYRKINGH